jgi:hypothetical protein
MPKITATVSVISMKELEDLRPKQPPEVTAEGTDELNQARRGKNLEPDLRSWLGDVVQAAKF